MHTGETVSSCAPTTVLRVRLNCCGNYKLDTRTDLVHTYGYGQRKNRPERSEAGSIVGVSVLDPGVSTGVSRRCDVPGVPRRQALPGWDLLPERGNDLPGLLYLAPPVVRGDLPHGQHSMRDFGEAGGARAWGYLPDGLAY